MLGVNNPVQPIKVGDSAELYAHLRIDGQPVSPDQIESVAFTIQTPVSSTKTTGSGILLEDGTGFYRFLNTTETGVYLTRAQFTLTSGQLRSTMLNFNVIDPFADEPAPTAQELITSGVWLRLEDIFDSIEGGPWLRDKTLMNFDENKIAQFIPEALLDINTEMPPTSFDLTYFTMSPDNIPGDNPNMPLLTQGVLVLVMKHLARSYIEQPVPNGQVIWMNRTQYSQMWTQMYQLEQKDFLRHLLLWKRTEYKFGQSALSVFSKAGRLFPFAGTNQATRGVYRGYY